MSVMQHKNYQPSTVYMCLVTAEMYESMESASNWDVKGKSRSSEPTSYYV